MKIRRIHPFVSESWLLIAAFEEPCKTAVGFAGVVAAMNSSSCLGRAACHSGGAQKLLLKHPPVSLWKNLMTRFLLQYAARKVSCKTCRERWRREESEERESGERKIFKQNFDYYICRTIYCIFTVLLFCSTKLNWEQISLCRIGKSAIYFLFM